MTRTIIKSRYQIRGQTTKFLIIVYFAYYFTKNNAIRINVRYKHLKGIVFHNLQDGATFRRFRTMRRSDLKKNVKNISVKLKYTCVSFAKTWQEKAQRKTLHRFLHCIYGISTKKWIIVALGYKTERTFLVCSKSKETLLGKITVFLYHSLTLTPSSKDVKLIKILVSIMQYFKVWRCKYTTNNTHYANISC